MRQEFFSFVPYRFISEVFTCLNGHIHIFTNTMPRFQSFSGAYIIIIMLPDLLIDSIFHLLPNLLISSVFHELPNLLIDSIFHLFPDHLTDPILPVASSHCISRSLTGLCGVFHCNAITNCPQHINIIIRVAEAHSLLS